MIVRWGKKAIGSDWDYQTSHMKMSTLSSFTPACWGNGRTYIHSSLHMILKSKSFLFFVLNGIYNLISPQLTGRCLYSPYQPHLMWAFLCFAVKKAVCLTTGWCLRLHWSCYVIRCVCSILPFMLKKKNLNSDSYLVPKISDKRLLTYIN